MIDPGGGRLARGEGAWGRPGTRTIRGQQSCQPVVGLLECFVLLRDLRTPELALLFGEFQPRGAWKGVALEDESLEQGILQYGDTVRKGAEGGDDFLQLPGTLEDIPPPVRRCSDPGDLASVFIIVTRPVLARGNVAKLPLRGG